MIRRLINKILGKNESPPKSPGESKGKSRGKTASGPIIIPKSRHGVGKEQISACALRTVTELQSAGFSAFVVGGAVRDLLLGRTPKDYDVATNATPDEVRSRFRRSRIIGRRFQIVHVMCGSETVEVSTFRANQIPGQGEDDDRETDAHGRLLRDNVFGSQVDDALRRDFTINALFYDPVKEEIWDYQDGVADLKKKRVRMIGDPVARYREDPVRMLRAVRFAAKLGFEIDAPTRQPISEHTDLLANVPKARVFDEMLKLLMSGHAVESVRRLRDEGLHHGLLPLLDVIFEQPLGEKFVMLALRSTDERVEADKPVSPAFLFATLLWHEVLYQAQKREAEGVKPIPALSEAMDDVFERQKDKLAIPRRYDATMKEIWFLQPRFLQRGGERPFRLLTHPRFRSGYDFFLLRADSGEIDAELGDWWRTFEAASDAERRPMLVRDTAPKKRRRRRGARRDGAEPAAITPADGGSEE